MANTDSQPTTFGAIIERKSSPSPPSQRIATQTSLSSQNLASPSSIQAPQPVRPALHLSNPPATVDAPLPSPYSLPDAHEAAPDLEAGLYKTPPAQLSEPPQPAKLPKLAKLATPIIVRTATPSRQVSSASTATSSTAGQNGNEKLVDVRSRELSMWPTQQEVKQKAKREKKARLLCAPMRKLSRRNRIIVSVVMALTIVAAAIGIGLGVSRAYNGSLWAGSGKNKPIPQA